MKDFMNYDVVKEDDEKRRNGDDPLAYDKWGEMMKEVYEEMCPEDIPSHIPQDEYKLIETNVYEYKFEGIGFQWSNSLVRLTEVEALTFFNSKHEKIAGPFKENRWVKV